MQKEYKQLSKYYDLINNEKNYKEESSDFVRIINKYRKSKGKNLLDLACGTGSHIYYLKKIFHVEGIDLSRDLIKIAKKKNPHVKFGVVDMRKIKSKEKYGVVTILFSSISYLMTKKELIKTLNNVHKILNDGGVLLIETVYLKDYFKGIKNHVRKYSDERISIKRILNISMKKEIYNLDVRYEIFEEGKPKQIIFDKHFLKAWTKSEFKSFLEKAGFKVKFFNYDKTGTKLFVCVKVPNK